MKTFEKLEVWKKSHSFVLSIYETTKLFPDEERYHLLSQLRRAATSIPANIVEGRARSSTKDYLRFLFISRGSLEEVEYLLMLSSDLDYINVERYTSLSKDTGEISAMLNGLIRSLRIRASQPRHLKDDSEVPRTSSP